MLLELQNLQKSFGSKQVLKGITFPAESGKAFGLLGRNGAGKTTSIRILMDVFPADSGEILLDGKPIDYHRIKMGYLPEERGLYPKKIIFDQLVYFAELKGLSRKQAKSAVDYWLNRLEMKEYRNKKLDTLSKGNQQKIQFITALSHNPDIIVLDEPFSGLDPVNAMLLKDVVKEQISEGKIVLFSSHQMNYIEEFCDNIGILNEGKIVVQGSIREIKRNYKRDRLVIRSEHPEQILQAFGSRCQKHENDELILKLTSPDEKKMIMQQLVSSFDIDEVRVFEPSLNDIFVQYTKQEEGGSTL